MKYCPACRLGIDETEFDHTNELYFRCPRCDCAIFLENPLKDKYVYDYEVELPDGSIKIGNPYTVIGNYIQDNAKKDWDLDFMDDFLAILSLNKYSDQPFTDYDRFYFDFEEGCYLWEHDWHEGQEHVKLVGYAPFSELAEMILEKKGK